jgi:hypothetical protein
MQWQGELLTSNRTSILQRLSVQSSQGIMGWESNNHGGTETLNPDSREPGEDLLYALVNPGWKFG